MIDRISAEDGVLPTFRMLSDPEHAVIGRYGLLNQEDPQDRPIPHPTTFVLDPDGVVRWKFIETNYRIRPANEDIIAALSELDG